MHLGGSAYTSKLVVSTHSGRVLLPIKKEHTYLGAKISYGHFARATVNYRITQSWAAFNRLHRVLISKALPLSVRLRLWAACVNTVLLYGLSSLILDSQCATKLRSHVTAHLRIIARSPAHVTHESNHQLYARLQMPDIVQTIRQHTRKRVSLAQRYLFQAQSTQVHDRWTQLLASCETNLEPSPTNTHLTEVTCSLRTTTTCPVCGITYASLHALRTHIGKSHPEHSTAKTGQGHSERSYRHSALMQHSLDGQPACVHCRKRFASWRSFAGHIVQKACPLLFPPVPSLSEGPAQGVSAPGTQQGTMDSAQMQVPMIQPLVNRKSVQDLATTHRVQELATAVRHEVLSGHCPICRYKCTDKSYISRHACFQHGFVKQAEPLVRAWARSHSGVGKPCKWCLQTFPQEPRVHQRSCIVLWTVGHLIHKFSALQPPGQSTLRLHGRGTREGSAGTVAVRGPHSLDPVPGEPPASTPRRTGLPVHGDSSSLQGILSSARSPPDSRADGHPFFSQARSSTTGSTPRSGERNLGGAPGQVLQGCRQGKPHPSEERDRSAKKGIEARQGSAPTTAEARTGHIPIPRPANDGVRVRTHGGSTTGTGTSPTRTARRSKTSKLWSRT